MSFLFKFIFFQIIILVPFLAGYKLRDRIKRTDIITKNLIKFNLIFIDPIIVFWTVWGLDFERELIMLPLFGLFLVILGLGLGYIFLPIIKLDRKRSVTFLISSSMANHGFTLGGFLCYIFLGERGLGLSFIFISYFILYLFLFIFPFANLASKRDVDIMKNIRGLVLTLRNMPLYSLVVALLLIYFGIRRPGIAFPIELFLIISIAVYYLSLGISFSFRDVRDIKRESFILSITKFILVPLITLLFLMLFDFSSSIKAVIIIQSFMPVAIYSVVTAILFDLDTKLASGLFVFNTVIFLIMVLPVMFILREVILGL